MTDEKYFERNGPFELKYRDFCTLHNRIPILVHTNDGKRVVYEILKGQSDKPLREQKVRVVIGKADTEIEGSKLVNAYIDEHWKKGK